MSEYQYPYNLNLLPNSKLSQIICQELKKRYDWSNQYKMKRISKWKEIDAVLTAYMPDNINTTTIKDNRSEKVLTFNIPLSLAVKEIFLTTLYNIFLKGNIIHYIKGIGGDIKSRIAGALLERVIAKQDVWFNKRLMLDAIWGDAITYGIGRGILRWKKRTIKKEVNNNIFNPLLSLLAQSENVNTKLLYKNLMEEDILFEGTEISPISPYDIIIDPRVKHYNSQEAEYSGYVWKTNKYDLIRLEQDAENMMFNCRYIQPQQSTIYSNDWKTNNDNTTEKPVECITICIKIIPNEFFQTNIISDKVENWLFTITSDNVVIQAHELNYYHGSFPIVDCTIGDTSEIFPISKLESIYPFQIYASWLLKTRAESIINSVNGKFVVDNSKVNIEDILSTKRNNIIRVKSTAYGEMDVRRYIHQLQFPDTTQQYLQDISIIDAISKQGIGATDIMQGSMTGLPERPTQLGINAIINSSYGRLSRFAMIINEMFMKEIGYQMCYNTQQFMSKEIFVPIAGYRYEEELRKEFNISEDVMDIAVDREKIKISFEIEPKTNLEPVDTDLQGLLQLMQILMQNPNVTAQTMQSYDLTRIFATVMRKLGIENLEDYKLEVKPDEEVINQAQQGNIVPVEKFNPQELYT